ncbi:hypothetical protein D3C80_681600 [compost metagenome]
MSVKSAPIVIIGFNRAEYLERVLHSLATQEVNVSDRGVYFFQDGAVNAYSGIRYADDNDLASCRDLFLKYFPSGIIHASEKNIGICENFDRAESFVFNELKVEVAYFFEDDMLLSPFYVEALDRVWVAVSQSDRIGYFAAYGDHQATKSEQENRIRDLIKLEHHWGFGLTRRHWLEMKERLSGYYDIVVGKDYRQRDQAAIRKWQISLGYAHDAISQDGAKALATNLLGRTRVMTFACWAKYIGEVGSHWNEKTYRDQGFADTNVMDHIPDGFELPSEEALDGFIQDERKHFRSVWLRVLGKQGERNAVEKRPVTEMEVRFAYELLLGRSVESDQIAIRRAGMSVRDLRDSILTSQEFLSKNVELVHGLGGELSERGLLRKS